MGTRIHITLGDDGHVHSLQKGLRDLRWPNSTRSWNTLTRSLSSVNCRQRDKGDHGKEDPEGRRVRQVRAQVVLA